MLVLIVLMGALVMVGYHGVKLFPYFIYSRIILNGIDSEYIRLDQATYEQVTPSYPLDIDDMEKMDTNIMKQRTYGNFCIQIEVYDTLLIPRIKESVMNYLSNNQRVLERNEIRLRQMEQLIPKLQKEIIELDSLKKAEYFSNNKPTVAKMGEMLLIGEKETKLYHKDVLELIGQQQKIERDLFLNKDPFEIILDFSVPTKEENSLFYLTTRFVGISLIIGFFIILFFDQRKFVFDQIKKSKEK